MGVGQLAICIMLSTLMIIVGGLLFFDTHLRIEGTSYFRYKKWLINLAFWTLTICGGLCLNISYYIFIAILWKLDLWVGPAEFRGKPIEDPEYLATFIFFIGFTAEAIALFFVCDKRNFIDFNHPIWKEPFFANRWLKVN